MATKSSNKKQEIKELAEASLLVFARLVAPDRLYGELHEDVFEFLTDDTNPNSLLLLPRAHQKSYCMAVYTAWRITREPEITVLYLSATTSLAESQLHLIKSIMTSDIYRRYWSNMVNLRESDREKWTNYAISVDHPKRKKEMVRDPTVTVAGLTTNTTGAHCDLIIADDVVVPDNAYTDDGRRKCSAAMSQMASILNTGGSIRAAGTRYHPSDQYQIWKDQRMQVYNEEGEVIDEVDVWNIMERVVETDGVFLWPREFRPDGKAFGFNIQELSRIKAMYTDRTQFYAQYYQNANDPSSNMISHDKFQYYDKKHIRQMSGNWYYKAAKLNVYAAIDFAYSMSKKADYSAIVVIGIDHSNNIYILDIDRFKTDSMNEYFGRVSQMHSQWQFKKLRTEVTAAQSLISADLKNRIKEDGMRLVIDEHRPTRHQGSKEERMIAALEHRYQNGNIWHYRGGYTTVLEEEVVQSRPAHDDLKDALASVIEIAVKPAKPRSLEHNNNVIPMMGNRNRFGGRH